MKLLLLGTLALLLGRSVASAQLAPTGLEGAAGESNLRDFTRGLPAVLPSGTEERVVGSPYADSRWLPARLDVYNARPLPPVSLKYDVLGRRLLIRPQLSGRPDSLVLDDTRVAGFVLLEPATPLGPGRQRRFRRFEESAVPLQRLSYVEVLHQGRYALLIYRHKTLIPPDVQSAYNTGRRAPTIVDHTEYYLRTPEGRLQPLKLSLKALQQGAPTLATALQAAVQALKPNSEADWGVVLDVADPPAAK
ncbi:hypothetical protein GCM10022409_00700 [Hymenobacter glaciei]|uniref:Uncharacterized protein n=1 Tax=Hymenobacter glaciei TaxID=877209 RepID=A0ABP7T4K9_9BACT